MVSFLNQCRWLGRGESFGKVSYLSNGAIGNRLGDLLRENVLDERVEEMHRCGKYGMKVGPGIKAPY